MKDLAIRIRHCLLETISDLPPVYRGVAGLPATKAPESLLCAMCAFRIRAVKGVRRVVLESPVSETLVESGADRRRMRHGALVGRKRFDLVVWDQRGPFALIELKHGIQKSEVSLRNDALRLARALCIGSGVGFPRVAYLGFDAYRKKSPRYPNESIEDQLLTSVHYALQAVDYYLEKANLPVTHTRHTGPVFVVNDEIWCPVVYELRRGRRPPGTVGG